MVAQSAMHQSATYAYLGPMGTWAPLGVHDCHVHGRQNHYDHFSELGLGPLECDVGMQSPH